MQTYPPDKLLDMWRLYQTFIYILPVQTSYWVSGDCVESLITEETPVFDSVSECCFEEIFWIAIV